MAYPWKEWLSASSIAVLAALFLGPMPQGALADWTQSEAAESSAGDLSDHEMGSENPNDLEGHSHDPNDLEAQSEDPNDLVVGAEDLDDHEAAPGKLADHEGHTEELQNLQIEAPDAGFRAIEKTGDDSWKHSSDPAVIVAGRHLERAEKRAEEARHVYGEMMKNDYPRGEPRERIIVERDASMQAVEAARAALHAAQGNH